MSDERVTAPERGYDLERIAELLEKATPGPWCAESCGEKGDGSDIIGIAYGPDDEDCDRPLSGWLEAFDDAGDEIDYYRDEEVAECNHRSRNPYENASLIVAAVNALPSMLADLRALRDARESGALKRAAESLSLDAGEASLKMQQMHADYAVLRKLATP